MSRISIIIVNYNGRHLLPDCLDGLEAQTRRADEVVLVDNGSTDDSVDLVKESFPWVRVIEAGDNLGFAGGNNLGIEHSTGDVVVLLNNDTLPGPGFVEQIVEPLERDRSISAVAGVLLFSRQPDLVASSGIEVFENGLALDRDINANWRELASEFDVFGPSGGAAAFRRDVLDDAGTLPESFFLYLEDADLAWRLRLGGQKTVSRRDGWALHVYSASSGESSGVKEFHLARNRAWLLIRCWPSAIWKRHWWAVLKYEFGALGYAVLTRKWRSIAGRWHGWTGFFALRKDRREIQARATASHAELLYWMRPVPTARSLLGLRRSIKSSTGEAD